MKLLCRIILCTLMSATAVNADTSLFYGGDGVQGTHNEGGSMCVTPVNGAVLGFARNDKGDFTYFVVFPMNTVAILEDEAGEYLMEMLSPVQAEAMNDCIKLLKQPAL